MGTVGPDEGRVSLLCKTRGFAFNSVSTGEPVKDFGKPVSPSKFVLYI